MIAKRITIFLITIFFICLYTLFLIFFQIPEMNKIQDNEIKKVIRSIYFDLKEKDIKNTTLKNIPKNLFFALWVKNNYKKWIPIIYDRSLLRKRNLYNPNTIPNSLYITTRIFNDKINDYQFVLWLNKYNIKYIMKHIVLSFLFLLLIYLILLLLIEIFLRENPILINNDQYEDNDYINYDAPTEKKEHSFIEENKVEENNIEEKLDEYKNLWKKNFNISDDFKSNFPFQKIYELVKIGIKPEKYIKESINIASSFFKWENPKFFLFQKNYFVNIETKETLNESNINIPLNGKLKGSIFIPLFPYNIQKIYGYLHFEWNNKSDYYLSDILFFLKYIFSERSKFIFLNSSLIENIAENLKNKLDHKTEAYSVIMNVDNKDKLISESNHDYIEKLNGLIKNKILSSFVTENLFQITLLNFILIGNTDDKKEKNKELQTWIKDIENQYYSISKEQENIAVTFSIGISYKNNRDLHPITLLNESENNLNLAIKKGGNIVISN